MDSDFKILSRFSMLSINFTVKNVDYRFIMHKIDKSEAINSLKNSVMENCVYVWKKYCLKLQNTQSRFFLLWIVSVYIKWLIVNTVQLLDLNISNGTGMENPEMLKFVPGHLKTKKMCKNAITKLPDLLRYAPDQYEAQKWCDKAI